MCRILAFWRRLRDRHHQQQEINHIENIFQFSEQGFAIISQQWRCRRVNPNLCHQLGYGALELLNMDFERLIYADDFVANLPFLKAMFSGELKKHSMQQRLLNRDGNIVWFNVDVTTVKQTEDQRHYLMCQFSKI